jgi:hypothetical protein
MNFESKLKHIILLVNSEWCVVKMTNFLDIINRLSLIKIHDVSETGFFLRYQVKGHLICWVLQIELVLILLLFLVFNFRILFLQTNDNSLCWHNNDDTIVISMVPFFIRFISSV